MTTLLGKAWHVMRILIVHSMHSSTIEHMLSTKDSEENYWGFLGFWNRMLPKLNAHGIELRFLLSEAFMPLLERGKAQQKLANVIGSDIYCLREAFFNDLWEDVADQEINAQILTSFGMEGYAPDLIIGHDNLTRFKSLFPESTWVGIEVGAFSRPPFLGSFYFDPLSFDCREIVDCFTKSPVEMYEEAPDILSPVRQMLEPTFNAIPESVLQYLGTLRDQYEKILVFAVQYPSPRYSPYTRHQSFLDIYNDILLSCPREVAVVVCPRAHNYGDLGVSEAEWEQLKNNHSNAELFPKELTWPYYTQMLVPHVDGVVAVTSTVGLQAALWGKHWFTSTESFYAAVTPSYKQIAEVVYEKASTLTAQYVNWMSQYFWMPKGLIDDRDILANYLKEIPHIVSLPSAQILPRIQQVFEQQPDCYDHVLNSFGSELQKQNQNKVIDILSL